MLGTVILFGALAVFCLTAFVFAAKNSLKKADRIIERHRAQEAYIKEHGRRNPCLDEIEC